MHQQPVPVLGDQGDEAAVVVAVADAGVESKTARRDADPHCSSSWCGAKLKAAAVKIRPEAPHSLRGEVAELIGNHGRRATGVSGAVDPGRESGFKERLRSDVGRDASGSASAHRSRATQRGLQSRVCGFEILAALHHHVRDNVEVVRLIFMVDQAPDIANFQRVLTVNLALDRSNRTYLRRWAGSLDQDLRPPNFQHCSRPDKPVAAGWRLAAARGAELPSTPMRKAGGCGRVGGAAGSACKSLGALHRLDQADTQQRHQHQVHAVQSSVYAAISPADDRGIHDRRSCFRDRLRRSAGSTPGRRAD